ERHPTALANRPSWFEHFSQLLLSALAGGGEYENGVSALDLVVRGRRAIELSTLEPSYAEGRDLDSLATHAGVRTRGEHDAVSVDRDLHRHGLRSSRESERPPRRVRCRGQDVSRGSGVAAHWNRLHVPFAGDVRAVDCSRRGRCGGRSG